MRRKRILTSKKDNFDERKNCTKQYKKENEEKSFKRTGQNRSKFQYVTAYIDMCCFCFIPGGGNFVCPILFNTFFKFISGVLNAARFVAKRRASNL